MRWHPEKRPHEWRQGADSPLGIFLPETLSMSYRWPLVVDTDIGTDDAVALVMALRSEVAEVLAVTAVAGNVELPKVVQNALYTVELCQAHTAVYAGSAHPMLRRLETAAAVHGIDGLGDIGLPLTGRSPATGGAVSTLVDLARKWAGELRIVAMGPLTNVALACLADHEFAANVASLTVMGGTGTGVGNVTPAAEFNIFVDPEAAKVVFESGIALRMVGWDACLADAMFSDHDLDEIRSLGSTLAHFCVDIQAAARRRAKERGRTRGICIPDALAMGVCLDPRMVTDSKRLPVQVETAGEFTRGETVVDHVGVTGRSENAEVVFRADCDRFLQMLRGALIET